MFNIMEKVPHKLNHFNASFTFSQLVAFLNHITQPLHCPLLSDFFVCVQITIYDGERDDLPELQQASENTPEKVQLSKEETYQSSHPNAPLHTHRVWQKCLATDENHTPC